MIHWILIQKLEEDFGRMFGPTEGGAAYHPIQCAICRKAQPPTHYAVTELYCDYIRCMCSRCNMAYKLICGHIVVDDCDRDIINFRTFSTEAEWKRIVVSKPME